MHTKSTFTGAGWSFYSIDGESAEWQMPTNQYPRLIWETSLDYDGLLSLEFKKNMQGQIDLEVFNIKTGTLNWTLTGHEECGWITSLSPVSGNSSGPGDRTVVTISVDATGLDCGHYACDLILSNDAGLSVVCPVRLHVELLGSGTVNDPYLIESLDGFDDFADLVNSDIYWASGVYTKLACNIDLSGRVYDTAVAAPDIPDTSFQFDGIKFEGVFDGDGHVIANMTIDVAGTEKCYLALFGMISTQEGSMAEVKMLGMENVNVIGGSNTHSVSGLCGDSIGGTISKCFVTGAISGNRSMGGLCGWNYNGTIINSYSTCSVTGVGGAVWSGGLCGGNPGLAQVINCYANGLVTGEDSSGDIGGLCGTANPDTLSNCFWDTQSSGTSDGVTTSNPDPAGVAGLETGQMQTVSTFTDAGWDFVGEDVNGLGDIWRASYVSGYPILSWQKDIDGDVVGLYGVDLADFAVFAENWRDAAADPACDLDDNDTVDIEDLMISMDNWLAGLE